MLVWNLRLILRKLSVLQLSIWNMVYNACFLLHDLCGRIIRTLCCEHGVQTVRCWHVSIGDRVKHRLQGYMRGGHVQFGRGLCMCHLLIVPYRKSPKRGLHHYNRHILHRVHMGRILRCSRPHRM